MDIKSEGQLCLENFIVVFSTDKKKKNKEDGKDEDKGVRGLQKHSFTTVIMEWKDTQGVDLLVRLNNLGVWTTLSFLQENKSHQQSIFSPE